ncbi:hypothetical protein ACLGGT_18695 [Roseovarius sp. MS2]|uniref:hypothetical protein n=1 Tax=Roseovarius sp. MS2 TaxID=3390728 RepID=UPI003EDB8809
MELDLAEPLPSLLERCESLLAQQEDESPSIRAVYAFGSVPTAVRHALYSFPNMSVVDFAALVAPRDSGLSDAARVAAAQGALQTLRDSELAMGRNLLLLIDVGHKDAVTRKLPPACDFPCLSMVLTTHPLQTYLVARNTGEIRPEFTSLQVYCEHYTRFLEANSDLVHAKAENVTEINKDGLYNIAATLRLRMPDYIPPFAPSSLEPWQATTMQYADGSPATDEPLDTPAYVGLCERLGYVSQSISGAIANPGSDVFFDLPARRSDRDPSRVASLMPRIFGCVEASARNSHVPPFTLGASDIIIRLEDCLGHPDGTLERLDAYVDQLPPRDAALLQIVAAEHFRACKQNLVALSLLAEADHLVLPQDQVLRSLSAELMFSMGKGDLGLNTLIAGAFSGPQAFGQKAQVALRNHLAKSFSGTQAEHGHALLLSYLERLPPEEEAGRKVLIEIGTTRETVPGQGSTEKLADRCAELGIDFVTVDMDPRNSAQARRMFRRKGYAFRAVTSKGEDFLAQWTGPIDYCFLDAYDFDHGMHSELRQSRYESFLGERIDDAACHKMHYDCATSLIRKLAQDGVICFDDTWTDSEGKWTAKGKTAMPLLLESGFSVLDATNRAALLGRGSL